MNLRAALKTRWGILTLVLILLGTCVLCGFGLLKGEDLPVISLAAENIPTPHAQTIMIIGFIGMGLVMLLMALSRHWVMLVVIPVGMAIQFLLFYGKPVPNTLPATWLTLLILLTIGFLYQRGKRKEGPPSRLVVALEGLIDGMLSFMTDAVGENARLFLPLVATFFLFIAISNWCGILPGFGSVGVYVEHHGVEEAHAAEQGEVVVEHDEETAAEHGEDAEHSEEVDPEHHDADAEHAEEDEHEDLALVPFFRSANAHLSTTLALALISVGAAQYYGFRLQGRHYLDKYINFRASSPKPDPESLQGLQGAISRAARVLEIVVNGAVGLIEIVLEALKVLPFSFRLFGNILAGEILLFVVSFLFAYIFPLVFLGLELFVGLIQGLIFAMLTLVFFSIAATAHHGEESH
jgi:F-type H+-transporting ATPase subunit a